MDGRPTEAKSFIQPKTISGIKQANRTTTPPADSCSIDKTQIEIMKKLIASLALVMATTAVSAQDNPQRLIVQPKQGNPTGYLVERIDSIYFTKINGRVAADITVQSFSTGETGDTIRLAVKKTADCQSFKITCMPTATAKALTTDAAVESYFNMYGGASYTDDFDNAVMTGFEMEFTPNSSYSIVTLGYDKYGIACSAQRADFNTPAADIVGNPSVSYVIKEVNYEDFTIEFTANDDCLGYYLCAFEAGTAQQNFDQWAPMMGFANMGDMIKQWSGQMFNGNQIVSQKWTQMTPGTDYEVYVLPVDINQHYGTMVIVPLTTLKYGGPGQATVDITIGEFGSQNGAYYQDVTYTPNDQASFMRDMVIDKSTFLGSADWGNGSEDAILAYLKDDRDGQDPYWNRYGVDAARWGGEPNKDYIAYAIAQNINGEWGPLAQAEFHTGAATGAPAKAFSVAKRVNEQEKAGHIFVAGKAPKAPQKAKKHAGITLEEVR